MREFFFFNGQRQKFYSKINVLYLVLGVQRVFWQQNSSFLKCGGCFLSPLLLFSIQIILYDLD